MASPAWIMWFSFRRVTPEAIGDRAYRRFTAGL
jgi:hypothetical protein